jgi:hypothetical protein
MESILPIIIGLAFILLQAFNANKKREAARQRPLPTNAPTPAPRNPFEQWLESLNPEEATDAVEQPVVAEETRAPLPVASPVTTILAPQAGGRQPIGSEVSEEERAAFALSKPTVPWWYTEEFDARKAVIYSEILKPKHF